METQERLTDRVRALMRRNLMEGYSALLDASYCYIAPSLERYQFRWFWDTSKPLLTDKPAVGQIAWH